jgi:sarcosine oxidase subunit gamma
MADLAARLPAELTAGRHGLTGVTAGAGLRIMPQRQIVSVIARRDGLEPLRAVASREFNVDLPGTPVLARGTDVSFLWCGHQQWFAMADEGDEFLAGLRHRFGASASLSDQSDSRLVVELSGPSTSAVLAKLAPIDLDPRIFAVGATALTLVGHVGGQITRTGEDAYELMVFRSFADSVLHGVLTAGAEFGVDISSTRQKD